MRRRSEGRSIASGRKNSAGKPRGCNPWALVTNAILLYCTQLQSLGAIIGIDCGIVIIVGELP
jgi:phage tail sheath protein FI